MGLSWVGFAGSPCRDAQNRVWEAELTAGSKVHPFPSPAPARGSLTDPRAPSRVLPIPHWATAAGEGHGHSIPLLPLPASGSTGKIPGEVLAPTVLGKIWGFPWLGYEAAPLRSLHLCLDSWERILVLVWGFARNARSPSLWLLQNPLPIHKAQQNSLFFHLSSEKVEEIGWMWHCNAYSTDFMDSCRKSCFPWGRMRGQIWPAVKIQG